MANRIRHTVVRSTAPLDDIEMLPQAIFGRPIYYFTLDYRQAIDDLDSFEYAAFAFNNQHHLCLRHYDGHPKKTVSLYLECTVNELGHLQELIRLIADTFMLPKSAILWQRGDPVQYGIVRQSGGRFRESEARILALKIAASCHKHQASTSYIKEKVPEYVDFTPEDLEPSPTRNNEKKWQQVVGNVISHQKQLTSIFSQGFATRTQDGLRVTQQGLDYLNKIGFEEKRDL
jgi:hypothetical protein